MRSLPVLLSICLGCGSNPPPSTAPTASATAATPATPAGPVESKVADEPPQAPAAEPAPIPKKPIHERLRDNDGKVPGLAGFSIQRKPDKNYCGGIRIITKRPKKVAKGDERLAAIFKLEFPTGLSFDPKNKAKQEASVEKVNKFAEEVSTLGNEARIFYEQQVREDPDLTVKINATARLAQIYFRLASVFAHAEIPADVRAGESAGDKIDAFCNALDDRAEPLVDAGEQAAGMCVMKLSVTRSSVKPADWWSEVCVER